MVTTKNAQNWFDNKYSGSEKKNVTQIREEDICGSYFYFGKEQLTLTNSLKVEGFTNLKKFSLGRHWLASLEISNCHKLTEIDLTNFSSSSLTSLEISNCSKLDVIKFHRVNFLNSSSQEETSLVISYCPKLVELSCSSKKLTKLDLVGNNQLTRLNCSLNKLTELDLGGCPNITSLDCSNNKLDNLEMTNCSKLLRIECSYNSLVSIDVNNEFVEVFSDNKNLTKKIIDKRSDANQKIKELEKYRQQSLSSEDTEELNSSKLQAKENLKNKLIFIEAQKWLEEEYHYPEEIWEIDISNENLRGELDLSKFSNLERLNCSNNKLTKLKLGENTNMVYLDCSHNQLKDKLDLTSNKQLIGLDCSFNELNRLEISDCPDLEMILCNDNKLVTRLNDLLSPLKSPDKLTYLNISDNNLQGDLSELEKFTRLEFLWVSGKDERKRNKLTGSLDFLKKSTELKSLEASGIKISDDIRRHFEKNNAEVVDFLTKKTKKKQSDEGESIELEIKKLIKNYLSGITEGKSQKEIQEISGHEAAHQKALNDLIKKVEEIKAAVQVPPKS